MEAFQLTELGVPLPQMAVYVFIITICMLLRRLKLGITTSYMFVLYWGYFYNREQFVNLYGEATTYMTIYIISGLVILVLGIISFFLSEK